MTDQLKTIQSSSSRGYFGIGVEGISKPMNLGNLFRSAHAFGASFVFTIDSPYSPDLAKSDTSKSSKHLPLYKFRSSLELLLPDDCSLVGVELLEEAFELPSFRHPRRAAYVLGPEKGSLSSGLLARCDSVVKIPTRFCVNVAMAGAIIMYDRALNFGDFRPRPVCAGHGIHKE